MHLYTLLQLYTFNIQIVEGWMCTRGEPYGPRITTPAKIQSIFQRPATGRECARWVAT